MDELLLGVIGLGAAWERYRAAIPAAEGVAITALHDPVAQRARSHALQLDCAAVEGFHALLQRADVHSVLILGRTWYGPQPLLAACRERIPALLSEPPTVSDLDRPLVRELLHNCVDRVFVEFIYQRCPATQELRRLVKEELGPPRSIDVNLSPLECMENDNVCGQTRGTVWIHAVAWCNALLGEYPSTIEVDAAPGNVPREVVLRYQSGVTAALRRGGVASRSDTSHPHSVVQVTCEGGTVHVATPGQLFVDRDGVMSPIHVEPPSPIEADVLAQFKNAVYGRPHDLTTIAEVLQVIELLKSAHDRWD